MLNNRTAVSAAGIAGGINFKSGDISGTAAKTADDRASQGMEYFRQDGFETAEKGAFIDRSTELYAALDSLALINASCIVRNQTRKSIIDDDDIKGVLDPEQDEKIKAIDDKDGENGGNQNKKKQNSAQDIQDDDLDKESLF